MVKATTRQPAAGHKMMKRAESAVSSGYGNTGYGVSSLGIRRVWTVNDVLVNPYPFFVLVDPYPFY